MKSSFVRSCVLAGILGGLQSCAGGEVRPLASGNRLPSVSSPTAQQLASVQKEQERLPLTPDAPGVEVLLRGVAGRSSAALMFCPTPRYGRVEVGCATGVRLLGDVPEPLISTPQRPVPVIARGRYDGEALVLTQVTALEMEFAKPVALDRDPYQNPCAPYQTPKPGPVNGSRSLERESERLRNLYHDRLADAIWDRTRQTMTLRFVGDVADIQQAARVSHGDRLCIVGGARMSMDGWSAVADQVQAAFAALPPLERPLLLSLGRESPRDVFLAEFETIDPRGRALVTRIAGADAVIEAFIELVDAPLSALPQPKYRGDIPLETSPVRTPGAHMSALGHFALHVDRASLCVYLEDRDGKRVMPSLPFGYVIQDAPLRLVSPSGGVVATEGQLLAWGGGFVDVEADSHLACSATMRFVGTPAGRK